MPPPEKKYRTWSVAGSPDVHNREEYAALRKQEGWDKGMEASHAGLTPLGKELLSKVKDPTALRALKQSILQRLKRK